MHAYVEKIKSTTSLRIITVGNQLATSRNSLRFRQPFLLNAERDLKDKARSREPLEERKRR